MHIIQIIVVDTVYDKISFTYLNFASIFHSCCCYDIPIPHLLKKIDDTLSIVGLVKYFPHHSQQPKDSENLEPFLMADTSAVVREPDSILAYLT